MYYNMKTTAEILEIVETLEKDYDFNDILVNYIDVDELAKCTNTDEVIELFRKANKDEDITRGEIIYYANAIEYLSENDPSLNDSISLAIDMWYELKNINSELLANLLKSDVNSEDFNRFLERLENELNVVI